MPAVHYYEEFPTQEEAVLRKKQVEREYHPCGYGTQLKVEKREKDAPLWVMSGFRYDTCD